MTHNDQLNEKIRKALSHLENVEEKKCFDAFFVEVLETQAKERMKGRETNVYQDAHQNLGIKPTTFQEFANRNDSAFSGESVYLGLL